MTIVLDPTTLRDKGVYADDTFGDGVLEVRPATDVNAALPDDTVHLLMRGADHVVLERDQVGDLIRQLERLL